MTIAHALTSGLLSLGLLAASSVAAPQDAPAPALAPASSAAEAPKTEDVRRAIRRGVDFLVGSQNEDGSWGGTRNKTMTDSFANVETHHMWTVGTTGLVCVALFELGGDDPKAAAACDRGLEFLCANSDLKRPADWDNDNVWGQVYGTQAIALALAHPRYREGERTAALRKAGETFLAGLKKFQSPDGGWGYYADPIGGWHPNWSTSFTTAAGVIAMCDAKLVGLPVDEKSFAAAVNAVEHCRLPDGAYTYSVDPITEPGRAEGINGVKGSLSRIQVCNLALLRAGRKVPVERIRQGLDDFFRHHKFLDVVRQKPIPHEGYYAIAAYFYFFGHYYAGRLLEQLPDDVRAVYAADLQKHVLKTIEPEGSMWDFYISSNTRPYGTAFGVLTLGSTLVRG